MTYQRLTRSTFLMGRLRFLLLALIGKINHKTTENVKDIRNTALTQGRNGVFQNIHKWMREWANFESGTVSRNGISFWKLRYVM